MTTPQSALTRITAPGTATADNTICTIRADWYEV